MIGLIDVLGYFCDGIFAFLYLGLTASQRSVSRLRRIAAVLPLMSTMILYPIGLVPFLTNNWIRFLCRSLLYASYLQIARGTRLGVSLYNAAFCATVYTLCHNALLTPLTKPLLAADIRFFTAPPAVNALLCALVIYGIKAVCYLWVYRAVPLSGTRHIGGIRIAVLVFAVLVSLYIKGVQQLVIGNNAGILPREFSIYFIILQAALLTCLVFFEQYQSNLWENTAWRVQAVTAQSLLKNLQLRQAQDEEVHRLRHDLKNHMLTLRHLAQNGQNGGVVSYVDNFLMQAGQGELRFQTGNPLLDSLMSEKLSATAQSGVSVSVVMDFRQGNFIEAFDLCIIMGNALDNAVESCLRMPEDALRFVEIRGGPSANLLIVYLSNSCARSVPMAGGLPATTKSDLEQHGFGLSNIQRALNKYSGELSISVEDDRFILTLTIPLPESKGQTESG